MLSEFSQKFSDLFQILCPFLPLVPLFDARQSNAIAMIGKILYPPHPSSKMRITPLDLPRFEGNWIAQRKFNGTHLALNIGKNSEIFLLNRHGESPKQFKLGDDLRNQILSLNLEPGLEYWFAAELLDAKTKNLRYKNKIVLFDVLQAGKYFFNSPIQTERLKILKNICRHPTKREDGCGIALEVAKDLWLAETFEDNFLDRFRDFIEFDPKTRIFGETLDEIEGLVLRKKNSVIGNFGRKQYDVEWMIRCRKPNKLYSF